MTVEQFVDWLEIHPWAFILIWGAIAAGVVWLIGVFNPGEPEDDDDWHLFI